MHTGPGAVVVEEKRHTRKGACSLKPIFPSCPSQATGQLSPFLCAQTQSKHTYSHICLTCDRAGTLEGGSEMGQQTETDPDLGLMFQKRNKMGHPETRLGR